METYGAFAEQRFLRVCVDSFGLAELPPESVKDKKLPSQGSIARATLKEDYGMGIDFYIYLPELSKWTPIDITVANDLGIIDKKLAKEKETGTKMVKLNDRDLRDSTHANIRVAEQACKNIARDLMTAIQR